MRNNRGRFMPGTSGNPNGTALPQWPAYAQGSAQWMVISETSGARADVLQPKLDLLESHYRERTAQ